MTEGLESPDEAPRWTDPAAPESPPALARARDFAGETEAATARVAEIVAAAEATAEELRRATEARAAQRIAEADRAAANRVAAAEEEAAEILTTARRAADEVRAEADQAARGLHEAIHTRETEAREQVDQMLGEAGRDAKQMRDEARAEAQDVRAKATTAARDIVADAHAAAGLVLREGEELSEQLGELGGALRTNATRLLRAVQAAHERLAGTLDAAVPRGGAPRARTAAGARQTANGSAAERRGRRSRRSPETQTLDVPEFLPPSGLTFVTARRRRVTRGELVFALVEFTPSQKGAIAETQIAAAAVELGIEVYRPISEGGRFDMVFVLGEELLRVQCKWAVRRKNVIAVPCYSCRRTADGFLYRSYFANEIDAIAAYCPDIDGASISRSRSSRAGGRSRSVWLPRENNQAIGVKWASDYRLGAIAQLGERLSGTQEAEGSSPSSSTHRGRPPGRPLRRLRPGGPRQWQSPRLRSSSRSTASPPRATAGTSSTLARPSGSPTRSSAGTSRSRATSASRSSASAWASSSPASPTATTTARTSRRTSSSSRASASCSWRARSAASRHGTSSTARRGPSTSSSATGDAPCLMIAVGTRKPDDQVVYPVSDLALKHDAGVQTETRDPKEAYAGVNNITRIPYPDGALPEIPPPAV